MYPSETISARMNALSIKNPLELIIHEKPAAILSSFELCITLNAHTVGADKASLSMNKELYRNPETGQRLADRRSGTDRRGQASFREFLFSRQRRRKSRGRRKSDKGAYVDIYDARTWGIVIAILLLSFMDALLTGLHVIRGSAREINPVLKAILDCGGLPAFFSAKAALTILPIAVIMIHKEWTLAKYAARLILGAYMLLTIYHLFLLIRIQGVA